LLIVDISVEFLREETIEENLPCSREGLSASPSGNKVPIAAKTTIILH
jgi:hypothetical protein